MFYSLCAYIWHVGFPEMGGKVRRWPRLFLCFGLLSMFFVLIRYIISPLFTVLVALSVIRFYWVWCARGLPLPFGGRLFLIYGRGDLFFGGLGPWRRSDCVSYLFLVYFIDGIGAP